MNSVRQMHVIRRIENTSSRNEKAELLRQIDPKILVYTYHPFKKYYIKPSVIAPSKLTIGKPLTDMAFRILDTLATGKYRGRKAAKLLLSYQASLDPASEELFRRIVLKDLRCGVSIKTINDVYPGLLPEEFCMLCYDYDVNRITFPCYVSVKVDGDRGIYKDHIMYSRSGRIIHGLSHIQKALRAVAIPLDGELKDPTRSFSAGSGGLRGSGDKSNYIYYVFDTLTTKAAFPYRQSVLQLVLPTDSPYIVRLPHYACNNFAQLERFYNAALAAGYEGIVTKSANHFYQYARSYDWLRKVPECHADVLCVGVYEGEGKYAGMAGGIEVMFHGKRNRVGTGLDDNERAYYFKYPDVIIGKFVEVAYKEETDYGNMRQARFKRIRYDK